MKLISIKTGIFFAPPPQHNTRLYYELESKLDSSDTITFEVLKPIANAKSSNAPFNSEEQIISYTMYNATITVRNSLRDNIQYIKELSPDSSDIFYYDKASTFLNKTKSENSGYQTIINYAKIVAKKHDLVPKNFHLTFRLTQIPIPKFKDRFSESNNKNEQLLFVSDKISL